MAAVTAATPLRASSRATYPMRRTFVSLSSFENPSPFDRFVRTSSPSRTSTRKPRARNSGTSLPASVVFPAPESPVSHRTNPRPSFSSTPITLLSSARRARRLLGLNQDSCDLGPRELDGRELARAEQLAHARARERDVLARVVRAGLRRGHRAARAAVESVVEEERRDAQLFGLELVEDVVRVVGAVVTADARVVAPDDEVRAAVVLPHERVEDRLARPRVAHRRREHGEDGARGRVVVREDGLVREHAHVRGDVVRLRLADERVQQEPVGDLQRALLYVLVRAVDGVASLEGDDAAPAALPEQLARLCRVSPVGAEGRMLRPAQEADAAAKQPLAFGVDGAHARVRLVGRAVDLLGLARSVAQILLFKVEHAEQTLALIE